VHTGALIVFEGAEGVGKTTQAGRLMRALESAGVACVYMREPGGTALGEAVRGVLLERQRAVAPPAEALLFMASRAQLVAEMIRPSLESGSVVVLDRFFLSTYAYQIEARGLAPDAVRSANQLAVGGLVPTVTAVLRLPAGDGLARAEQRSGHDYMEKLGDDFHARVSAAFDAFTRAEWQAAHPECGPIVSVDASGSPDTVFERVLQAVVPYAPRLRIALAVALPGALAQEVAQ
jgi:dTMP kinase